MTLNYVKVVEQATLQPDVNSGMGFPEDDDDDEEMSSPRSGEVVRMNANRHKQLPRKAGLMIRLYLTISVLT